MYISIYVTGGMKNPLVCNVPRVVATSLNDPFVCNGPREFANKLVVQGRCNETSFFAYSLARVEFPIQLVGRLPHQLCLLPHQLYGLPHQFLMNFLVFRLHNVHVNPELSHDLRI